MSGIIGRAGSRSHIIPFTPSTPYFQAYAAASTDVASGTSNTLVAIANETYDTHGWYDTSASRFTPLESGVYAIFGQLYCYAGDGVLKMQILRGSIMKNTSAAITGTTDGRTSNWYAAHLPLTTLMTMINFTIYSENCFVKHNELKVRVITLQ